MHLNLSSKIPLTSKRLQEDTEKIVIFHIQTVIYLAFEHKGDEIIGSNHPDSGIKVMTGSMTN